MRDRYISRESARYLVDHSRWEPDVYPCSSGWSVVASIFASVLVAAIVFAVWWLS